MNKLPCEVGKSDGGDGGLIEGDWKEEQEDEREDDKVMEEEDEERESEDEVELASWGPLSAVSIYKR